VLDVGESPVFGLGSYGASLLEDTSATGASGTISFNDPDLAGPHMLSVARLDGTGSGTMSATISQAVDPVTGNGLVAWGYAPDQAFVQSLRAGETVSETFQLSLAGLPPEKAATATVMVTVTGQNDVATVTGQLTGALVEDTTLTATGKMTVSDVDKGEASFVAGTYLGDHGELALDTAGQWTYTLTGNDSAAIQALGANQSLVDTVTVRTLDGTETQLAMTIAGAAEATNPALADYTFDDGLQGWQTLGSFVTVVAEAGRGSVVRLEPQDGVSSRNAMLDFLKLSDTGSAQLDQNAMNGTAIRTEMNLEKGQYVSFDWRFLDDDGGIDFGIFSLDSAQHSQATTLSKSATNWSTAEFQVEATGTYTIGFASMNGYDDIVPSTLLIDNVRFTDASFIV
jgi:VCBS repeat-containing protein